MYPLSQSMYRPLHFPDLNHLHPVPAESVTFPVTQIPVPGPSHVSPRQSSGMKFSVEDIRPLPTRTSMPTKRRTTSGSTLLTGSPHKRTLKGQKLTSKESWIKLKPQTKRLAVKRGATKNTKHSKKVKISPPANFPGQQSTTTLDDTPCIVCGEHSEEDWIKCHGWTHEACADIWHADYNYCDSCTRIKETKGPTTI